MNLSGPNSQSSLLPVVVRPDGLPAVPPHPERWPEPVEGPVLLNQVANTFARYLVLPPGAADTLALMITTFHCFDAFLHAPRLSYQAMEKGCGKTTALEITACLSPGPCVAENMSTAVLFRITGYRGVTVLLDEVDAWLLTNEEMRGLLNAGHRRGGQVWRCETKGGVRCYNVFAPVVLAGIGTLPDTLQDRSIVVRLTRAKPGEIKARFDSRRTSAEDQLRAKVARWAGDISAVIDRKELNMKHKIPVALVAVVLVSVSLAAFADKQASAGKVFFLKSGGKAIAQLRVLPSANVAVQCADSSGQAEYNMSTGALVARGGAALKLTAGTNSVTVRADEIESVPEAK